MKSAILLLMLLLGSPDDAERERAKRSLEAARNALAQADQKAGRREEAAARLKEAEAHFQAKQYAEAGKAADDAWQLALTPASQAAQSFSVEVSEAGTTTVEVRSGKPVSVKAQNVTREVAPGESVRVEQGQPPLPVSPPTAPPVVPLAAPKLTSPGDRTTLTFQPVKGRLGPVTLSWKAVEGARAYEVEVQPTGSGSPVRMVVNTVRAQLPRLPAGRYRWTVRAVGQDAKSETSAARYFELVDESLKLEVKDSDWK